MLTKPKLLRNLRKRETERDAALPPVDQWLYANLKHIQIDDAAAYRHADRIPNQDSRLKAIEFVSAIADGCWHYSIGPRHRRRSTNLTNLHKTLRKYLTVDGFSLTSLDISESQPIIIGLMLTAPQHLISANDTSVDGAVADTPASAGGVPPDRPANAAVRAVQRTSSNSYRSTSGGTPIPFMLPRFSDTERDAKQRFLEDALAGKLYQKIADHANRTRDDVKPWVLRAFFYDPRKWRKRSLPAELLVLGDVIDALKEIYPGVYEWSLRAREHDYHKLNYDVARNESYVIFNMICSRIHRLRPETFVATLHDSLFCKEENAAFVRAVMDEQFCTLGVQPTIKQKPA